MIIAFCGLKTSGKTTAAEYLTHRGFKRESFASPLKEAAKIIFQLDDAQVYGDKKEVLDPRWDKTPRSILQLLGTEVGRSIDDEVWIKNMQSRLENAQLVVIDDCRFPNEAEAVKKMGGVVVGIKRPGLTIDDHPSELELMENWCSMVDIEINNSDSIWSLYAMLERLLDELRQQDAVAEISPGFQDITTKTEG